MSGGPPRMLEGVRIVDLTSVMFGPYCTQLMADMGADVIKVEAPSGDIFRRVGKPAKTRGMGGCHMTVNRGKRSVALDLKSDEGKAYLRELAATADVFIHNVRGKAIERLGFDYAAVKAIRPDIVYVHCTGFGSGGPYADLQAYDDVIQAATGATSLIGKVDGDPRPRYLPTVIADKVGGLTAAYAVLAAYVHRLRTGAGQFVEVPMFEAFAQFLLQEHLNEATFDPPTGPLGYDRQLAPNRQPFPTADGAISIVPYTDDNWGKIFQILGDPQVMDDPRFQTALDRLKHADELYGHIARLTPARTTADWMERLSAAHIPAMPARDMADIRDDPHLRAVGFFRPDNHPTEGGYLRTRPPVRFSAALDIPTRHAPCIGEHTDEVRAELDALKAARAAAEVITLHHCAGARSFRPLWMLEEMGLDYRLELMPFPPRARVPGYKALNPMGTVPTLVDGEVLMTESVAICQYLAGRYGPTPLAVEPHEPGYGAWLNFLHMGEATLTFPQTIVLRYAQLEPEDRRLPQAAADYANWFIARLKGALALMEGGFACAGRFTAADISIGYALQLATYLKLDDRFPPEAAAYYRRLKARDGYRRARAAETSTAG